MKTPTEQAMLAAEAIHPEWAEMARFYHGGVLARKLLQLANTIDTATNLPALIAERDALRKALEEMVYVMAPLESEKLTTPFKNARAALSLNAKGQP